MKKRMGLLKYFLELNLFVVLNSELFGVRAVLSKLAFVLLKFDFEASSRYVIYHDTECSSEPEQA
jgi:hypothetical protein